MARELRCLTRRTTRENFLNRAGQKESLGFLEARIVALSCAVTGAIIDATIGSAKGKATGELSQMRILPCSVRPNDMLVGDAIDEPFWTFMMVQDICCDGVFENNGSRYRPGKGRTQLTLQRPARPEWMELKTYQSCPEQITVRQVVNCQRGYQPRVFLTTLNDRNLVSDKQIVKQSTGQLMNQLSEWPAASGHRVCCTNTVYHDRKSVRGCSPCS